MRILCVTQPNSGVGYHRQILPLQELADVYVLFADFINDEVLGRGFDIIMVNRFIPGVSIDDLTAYRRKYDFKLVVDIDDYWHLDPWHILYNGFPTQNIIAHITQADLVTTTHESLLNKIRPLNDRVEILPNALPYGRGQFIDARIPHDQMSAHTAPGAVRIVYAGGITHEKDIALLRGPMKRISGDRNLRDRMHMIMCGYDESNPRFTPVWHRMISDYLCGFKMPGYVRGPLMPTDYMAFYCEADMTVAPLVPSTFNACKSNLKVLEAGVKKVPIVVTNTPPYNLCPYALKVEVQPDWYNIIKMLVTSESYREDMGAANHAWCVEHHHLDKWNVVRKQMYENLIA